MMGSDDGITPLMIPVAMTETVLFNCVLAHWTVTVVTDVYAAFVICPIIVPPDNVACIADPIGYDDTTFPGTENCVAEIYVGFVD